MALAPLNEEITTYPVSLMPHSLFSTETLSDLRAARADAEDNADLLRACDCADAAVKASDAGDRDSARQHFARMLPLTNDLRHLFAAFQFHFRAGHLDEAERFTLRRLELANPDSPDAARACTNLGLIQFTRKDLGKAEEWHRRALDLDRRLGNEEGIARDLGNLAMVPESRGELDEAQRLYHESLAIAERIGAKAIIATKLSNLGDIALLRGDREQTRSFWKRAIALFEETGQAKYRDEVTLRLNDLQ